MDRIMITGASGFVGKALVRELIKHNYVSLLPLTSSVNLTQQDITYELIRNSQPDIIIHLAATVGGIKANQQNPGRFFYNNIMMGVNLIDAARIYEVKKFIQIGTVCSYPKHTPVPFQEEFLWNGFPRRD
jgi:GDP-L-fucose synthase